MRTTRIGLLFSVIAITPVIACDVPPPLKCDANSWAGKWQTNWGDMDLKFTEDETFVGTYGPSGHAVVGELDPEDASVLAGIWTHAGTALTGRFRFKMTKGGTFGGTWTWGDLDPATGGGAWAGRRPAEIKLAAKAVGEAEETWTDKTGKRWVSQKVQLENNTGEDFFVYGYSKDQPFVQISVRDPETGKTKSLGLGYCGTGAGLYRIERGASFMCHVDLCEAQVAAGFVVELTRYPRKELKGGIRIRTGILQVSRGG